MFNYLTWLNVWLLAAAFAADPERPPPCPKPPPPWLNDCDEAPALAAAKSRTIGQFKFDSLQSTSLTRSTESSSELWGSESSCSDGREHNKEFHVEV